MVADIGRDVVGLVVVLLATSLSLAAVAAVRVVVVVVVALGTLGLADERVVRVVFVNVVVVVELDPEVAPVGCFGRADKTVGFVDRFLKIQWIFFLIPFMLSGTYDI